ncbi:hypothetical protein T01_1294 [Trichinella spiralis]|uniref:Uncharacterized protein n=1 Tax=Trichinella spiralis TaxID=6334 RepID=A0A0V1B7R9_TRISP|nr:hypothetical protein T01_1294 [Trichinella spiralis]
MKLHTTSFNKTFANSTTNTMPKLCGPLYSPNSSLIQQLPSVSNELLLLFTSEITARSLQLNLTSHQRFIRFNILNRKDIHCAQQEKHSLLGHWHKFLWSRAIVVELNVRLGSYEQLILKDAIVAVKNVVISRLKAGAAVLPSHQRGDRLQLLNTGVPNQTYPIDERDKSRRFSR